LLLVPQSGHERGTYPSDIFAILQEPAICAKFLYFLRGGAWASSCWVMSLSSKMRLYKHAK
jgi:hypothetical protein